MMKAALLGYGTVGGGVDRIIQERDDIRITRILEKYPKPEIADRVARDMDEIVADPEIDIVIELLGGVHPAFEFVKAGQRVLQRADRARGRARRCIPLHPRCRRRHSLAAQSFPLPQGRRDP